MTANKNPTPAAPSTEGASGGDHALYRKLRQKLSRVHISNQAPDCPLQIKLTYGEIARLSTAILALSPASDVPPIASSGEAIPVKPANIGALGEMLDCDIARQGSLASFMIRAGLLRDILDELYDHRAYRNAHQPTPPAASSGQDLRFLLVKRGLYYRPDNQGYTGIKDHAGRYAESEADALSGVEAIHEDDAPQFSAACWDDVKVKFLIARIAELEALLPAPAVQPGGDLVPRDAQVVFRGSSNHGCSVEINIPGPGRHEECRKIKQWLDTLLAAATPLPEVGEKA